MKHLITKILSFCFVVLAFTACGSARHTTGVKMSTIPEFAFIQPCAYMVFYEDDGRGYYNQSSSDVASQVIANVINSERFPFTDMIPADFQGNNNDIFQWAQNLTEISGLTNPSRSYTPSDPYGNMLVCVVVDAQVQRVIYYAKQIPTFASHPKDNADVSKLLHKLLKDFIR